MAVSFPFQQESTWRKLGYIYYTDSLAYRAVLEQNPQWKVTELPPIGAQIRVDSSGKSGGVVGGLSQGSFIFGLPSGEQKDLIFPFETDKDYTQALNRYTVQGVVDRNTLNGITLDDPLAIRGTSQVN
jgi:phage baseplate assembly protein gpV